VIHNFVGKSDHQRIPIIQYHHFTVVNYRETIKVFEGI